MPRFTTQFEDRTFAPVLFGTALRFTPVRFSMASMWGPKACEIHAEGDETAIFRLMDWLRYGVKVLDEYGTPCWWGFIAEVEITIGGYSFGLSLDSMANTIAVAYNQIVAGQSSSGSRTTTAWSQDATSVAAFGIKEALLTFSDATGNAAARFLAQALVIGKNPVSSVRLATGTGLSATITCRGWPDMLNWRYFTNASEGSGYTYVIADGEGTVNTYVAAYGQTFQLSGLFGCTLTTIELRANEYNTPPGVLIVELHADGGSEPGTVLATRTAASGSIGYVYGWHSFDFTSANITLAAGTTYWLVIGSTSDASNYYQLGVSAAAGYGAGQGKIFTSAWATATWDMFFRINGTRDTADVIRDMITTYGQGVFPSVVSSAAAGVFGSAYGDGDTRVLKVVEDQLNSGTSSSLRLLSRVLPDRTVSLSPEPASPMDGSNPSYLLDAHGQWYTNYGTLIEPWKCPCAGWARLIGVIPSAADRVGLTNFKYMFIEENEYDVGSNTLTPTPRGQRNVFDMGGVR